MSALKAWWLSTDADRRFVEVETNISRHATLKVLKEIKKPKIRASEAIMYARALLLPLKPFSVARKRKGNTLEQSKLSAKLLHWAFGHL
jgi:hypothetical protein